MLNLKAKALTSHSFIVLNLTMHGIRTLQSMQCKVGQVATGTNNRNVNINKINQLRYLLDHDEAVFWQSLFIWITSRCLMLP